MDLNVTVKKNGAVVGTERLTDPDEGDVAAAIGRITGEARKRAGKSIWPVEIDVRQADA